MPWKIDQDTSISKLRKFLRMRQKHFARRASAMQEDDLFFVCISHYFKGSFKIQACLLEKAALAS
jgi:hypothetical protein